MKRIIAALKGKVENMKIERKVTRVERAIDTAIDNAQDNIDRIEEEKMRITRLMADRSEVTDLISKLSDHIGDQEEQEAIIDRLKKVKAYINEEIEVEDDTDNKG
jgi:hypothetical protein